MQSLAQLLPKEAFSDRLRVCDQEGREQDAWVLVYLLFNVTVSGLSCRTRDLHHVMQDLSLQHSDSLVVARGPGCSLA